MEINKKKPSFIGIGAQKSGTSWLYMNLYSLSGYNLLPIKEIHYFDRYNNYNSSDYLSKNLWLRFSTIKWWRKNIRYVKILQKKRFLYKKPFWCLNWFFGKYNDDWYLSLYKGFNGISGEITPSYSMLVPDDIKKMYKVAPEAKIIFLIRNPIQRAWSQYKSSIEYVKDHTINVEQAISFFKSEHQTLRSNYLLTIRNYLSFFPANQFLICFYDAIEENPNQLLMEVNDFLDAKNRIDINNTGLNIRYGSSKEIEMPIEIRMFLEEFYKEDIYRLSKVIGGYSEIWYNKIYESDKLKINKSILKASLLGTELNLD